MNDPESRSLSTQIFTEIGGQTEMLEHPQAPQAAPAQPLKAPAASVGATLMPNRNDLMP